MHFEGFRVLRLWRLSVSDAERHTNQLAFGKPKLPRKSRVVRADVGNVGNVGSRKCRIVGSRKCRKCRKYRKAENVGNQMSEMTEMTETSVMSEMSERKRALARRRSELRKKSKSVRRRAAHEPTRLRKNNNFRAKAASSVRRVVGNVGNFVGNAAHAETAGPASHALPPDDAPTS